MTPKLFQICNLKEVIVLIFSRLVFGQITRLPDGQANLPELGELGLNHIINTL